MTQKPIAQRDGSPLFQVKEGMAVYDRRGEKIGTVEAVHFGVDTQRGVGAATASTPGERDTTIVGLFWDAFTVDQVPQVHHARLMQHRFIRIDSAGLLAADRYVMPDQIAWVDGDSVHLQAERDALVKS